MRGNKGSLCCHGLGVLPKRLLPTAVLKWLENYVTVNDDARSDVGGPRVSKFLRGLAVSRGEEGARDTPLGLCSSLGLSGWTPERVTDAEWGGSCCEELWSCPKSEG